MQTTITPAAMQLLEQDFMQTTCVSNALLMELAAQGVVQSIRRHAHDGAAVLFLCGPGNNGGDGYAAARRWQAEGSRSVVMELSDTLSGAAGANRTLAALHGIPLLSAEQPLPEFDLAVDALFGTGLTREITGVAADLISRINDAGKPVIAVDIPSGINGLNGKKTGPAIRADETVTFHRPKPGLFLQDGITHAGKVIVHPIAIPSDWQPRDGTRILESADLKRIIPPRPADGHKGTFGKTVIFAGSPGMAGAAAYCAKAAIRSGSGLTYLLCRESIVPVLQTLVPGAVCRILPEENGRLTEAAYDVIRDALSTADSAVIGCGLGQSDDLLPALALFRSATCPVVWDADALNLLAAHQELLPLPGNHVITPHPGEASRLLGLNIRRISENMPQSVSALSQLAGCHALLKGARTVMTDGSVCAVQPVGTPAMAKGGSGDILSGILGALLAGSRCLKADDQLELIQAAVMIHASAGIRAAASLGEGCVTPDDTVRAIRLTDA